MMMATGFGAPLTGARRGPNRRDSWRLRLKEGRGGRKRGESGYGTGPNLARAAFRATIGCSKQRVDQAVEEVCAFRVARYPTAPRPTKPISIMAWVDGSGITLTALPLIVISNP